MDGDAEENQNPVAQTEADEFIEVVYAPVNGLLEFLEGKITLITFPHTKALTTCIEQQKAGNIIDGKIWIIAHTLKHLDLLLH